ncbi:MULTISPECIES: flagellin N-terminal helical domain-containing protein [Rhizobium/Agrobacterium group]|jgi:flagellin|uniref:Flagellin n=2 Tax=Rhizobium/Agrobacterium group TaxID=227290 RepID=A0AA92C381_RHIRH|nr:MULTISPECIES: flagellin [Rhizobium/Agrobacterium group]KQM35616.1 flagellin [Rhizobium sp. Leaf202]KQN88351.1 flagellin [Rhizobium sp. Leaf68]MDP9569936.1 flagellin [Agrobacterium larrymoorei]PVE66592.1 flagellin [Agrobacterium tumefaciens]PVE76580.1 flagellin [Sphingomonas sp. TPD3009]
MSSINFNSSATNALQTLRDVNSKLQNTQNTVSTGLKVSSAKDNVAYWSISTTMKSDNKALGAATDALGVGAAKVDTAYAAMDSAIDVVNEIKSKLVTASESSVDKDQVNLEIEKLQEQLTAIGQAASFNGENWMVTSTKTTVVDGFTRKEDGTVKINTAEFQAGSYAMFSTIASGVGSGGILSAVMTIELTSAATQGKIDTYLSTVETALKELTKGAAALGAMSTRIDLQDKFASKISDAMKAGVSKLVDADMEEESARLASLQTQQQLAVQSLSIANNSSQSILSLFR